MKLDFELYTSAAHRVNPCLERELVLREYQIQRIENLGLTQNAYDCLNFCNNEIKKVENFPPLPRLTTLLLSNNHITQIEPDIIPRIPNLHTLCLNNNSLEDLSELVCLKDFKYLTHLTVLGNPVAYKPFYRSFLIFTLPQLHVLDFQRITLKERKQAAVIFAGTEGKKLLDEISRAKLEADHKRIEESRRLLEKNQIKKLTEEERANIKTLISQAKTLEEIQRLERQLKA